MTGRQILILLAAALSAWPAAAQRAAVPAAPAAPAAPIAQAPAKARTILFVGNSFTYAAYSPVRRYRAETVTDLNQNGIGGVPALFKRFTEQVGLNYAVSLETSGGKGLDWHYDNRRTVLDRAWDVVILQGHSLLDRERPGDPALHVRYAGLLAAMFAARNPAVDVELSATWARADMVYLPGSRWSGQPLERMALDLRRGADLARAAAPQIRGIIPVGEAWNRAIAARIADPNPYDGITFDQVDLWTYDHYHGSAYGYYLEALLIFGRVTGIDPRRLGAKELAADDLGFAPSVTEALQRIAAEQLVNEAAR